MKSVAFGIVVLAALFGMIAPVQALPTVYGYVYGTDGTTPIEGAEVTATNLMNTGWVETVTTTLTGHYENGVNAYAGDKIKVVATSGELVASATITVPDPWAPTRLDLTLHPGAPTPILTPTGLFALVSLLSAIAAVAIVRKRR